MPAPNPPLNRLKWVAQQYKDDPVVVLQTYLVLFHTVVGDRVAREVFSLAMQEALARPADFDLFAGVHERWPVPRASVNERASRGVAALFEQLKIYEGGIIARTARIDRRRYDTDPLWPWVARQISQLRKIYLDVADPFEQRARGLVHQVRDKANAIALWAKENKIDLGKWSFEDALSAVEDFEVTRKTIPQGHVVYEYDDGWTVQLLQTPEELKVEGEVMQHCVGEYYEQVTTRQSAIFSIRDKDGRPHVTIEWATGTLPLRGPPSTSGTIAQIQGKQNEPPAEKYRPRVIAFLQWWPKDGIKLPQMTVVDDPVMDPQGMAVPVSRAILQPWSRSLTLLSMGADPQTVDLDFQDADLFTHASPNIRGRDLSGANFSGATLNEFDVRGTIFHKADFRGASLISVYATGADFSGADFRPSERLKARGESYVTFLKEAVLDGANLSDARFDGAVLDDAALTGAYVDGTVFDRASLKDAVLVLRWTKRPPSFKGADVRTSKYDQEDAALLRLFIRDRALLDKAAVQAAVDLGIATDDDFEQTEDFDMDTFRARKRAA